MEEEKTKGEDHVKVEGDLLKAMNDHLRNCTIEEFKRLVRIMLGVDMLWGSAERIEVKPIEGEYSGCFGVGIEDDYAHPSEPLDKQMKNKFFVGTFCVTGGEESASEPFTVVAPHESIAREMALKTAREYYETPDKAEDLEPMQDGGFYHHGGSIHVELGGIDAYPNRRHAGEAMFKRWALLKAEFLRVPIRKDGDGSND